MTPIRFRSPQERPTELYDARHIVGAGFPRPFRCMEQIAVRQRGRGDPSPTTNAIAITNVSCVCISITYDTNPFLPSAGEKNKPAEAGLFLYMLVNNYF